MELKFYGRNDGRFIVKNHASSSVEITQHSEVRNPVPSYVDDDYFDESIWYPEVRNQASYDDDDVLLSEYLSRPSTSRRCSSNCDVSVNKRCNTAPKSSAVKRPSENNGSLNISVKKSKVSPFDNARKDKDDTPLSRNLAMPVGRSADKSLSSLKKELAMLEKSIDECKKKKQEEIEGCVKDFAAKQEQLGSLKKELAMVEKSFEECKKNKQEEEERLRSIKMDIEELSKEQERANESHKKRQEKIQGCIKDFEAKQEQLGSLKKELAVVEKSFEECKKKKQEEEGRLGSIKRDIEELSKVHERTNESYKKMQEKNDRCIKDFRAKQEQLGSLKKELAVIEKSFEECKNKKQEEEGRLGSIMRDIDEFSKVHERIYDSHMKMQEKIEEFVKDYKAKQEQLYLTKYFIGEHEQELKTKEIELCSIKDNINKVCEGKEQKLKDLSQKIVQCTVELEAKEKERDSMKKLIDEQAEKLNFERRKLLQLIQVNKDDARSKVMDFESTKKQFEEKVKALELKEKRCSERALELESREKLFECRVNELMLKEKQHEDQVMEFRSDVDKFHGQKTELESEKKHFDSQMKELKEKERQLDVRAKQVELIEEELQGRANEFHSKEEQLKGQVKDLQSKENQLSYRVKELVSEKKQLERQLKESQAINEEFEGRVKGLKSREELFDARMQELKRVIIQMDDFKSEEKQFEGQGKKLKSKHKEFKVHAKELEQKEKQSDGCMKDLELREKQNDALIEPSDKEMELGNYQSSPTSEQIDDLEFDDILVNLQAASDPSKFVLDTIQNAIIQKCKMGDAIVIIEDRHICLLEELRRISPDIRPHAREEAMKLAVNLKANMKENNENSSVVLGFLLVMSIYGLVSFFNEEEVYKLFGLVSEHKIVVELFGSMGFADKISDFVKYLIKRRQYDEAVRFSRAYNFSDNHRLVALFEEHVQNLKLISESRCKKTNWIEIKDKARSEEIASLIVVLKCIQNIQLQDLHDKIKDRLVELKRQISK